MSKGFETFAAATAAVVGGLVANDLYWVAGQTTAGDGLEGWFSWHPGATGTPDANLITHASGRFRRATFAPVALAQQIAEAVKAAPLGEGTDRSGAITAGGTAQVLMPANANRIFADLQNTSAGVLRVNEYGAASVSAGYELKAGGYWTAITNNDVSVWGATTGQAFIAQEK